MMKTCNKPVTDKYVKHISLKIDPYPILLAGGAKIAISLTAELLKDIPVGTMVKLKLHSHNNDEMSCFSYELLQSVSKSKNYPHMTHHNTGKTFNVSFLMYSF